MECKCNICKTGGVCLEHHRKTEEVNADLLKACKRIQFVGEYEDAYQGMRLVQLFPTRFKCVKEAIAKAEELK